MGKDFNSETGGPSATDLADRLRRAMRATGASVSAVTTTMADGSWRGATINSMISVTLSPPSILVSLNSASRIHAAVLEHRVFAVNVFAAQHAEIAAVFADPTRHDERFAEGDWQADEAGLPILADAAASFACTIAATLPFGTHTIIIGEVDRVQRRGDARPLVYHDGHYGAWSPIGGR